MKKSMKIVSILLVVMMVFALTSTAFAVTLNWDNAQTDLNNATIADSSAKNSVANMAKSIIDIIQVVGMGVAVVMLIVLAIKYISAAPSDKAEIKKHAVVYVVGAIVLFAASGILEIVQKFAGNIG